MNEIEKGTTAYFIERIAALEAQVAELEGSLPGRMKGCQVLADEKCRCFLVRAETAEARLSVYASGGFADADALAAAYLDVINERAALEAQVATAIAMRDLEERNKIDFIQQLERSEAQNRQMEAMRTHCENCGADYMATGIEAGCPCLLRTKIAALEAQNRQLREALEKIRDGDSDCECDDHTSPECCANIEWNDGSCCPHCVAGAALAAAEEK